jgi:2-polyprenyl-6-hydroxyphenyl methylase/3-demethylubiquinone-9 3-methyltransferase
MDNVSKEVLQRNRFKFGQNWENFLSVFNEDRIIEAERSLKEMLEVEDLKETSFLDIGSGSGLFSLAARRLGAEVHSFDYDPMSVACSVELKRRYFPNDTNWRIEKGDVLDQNFLTSLGRFHIVYAWGVLHHTGAMYQAMENIIPLVQEGGELFISIYNDQGIVSRCWRGIKKFYNLSPRPTQWIILIGVGTFLQFSTAVIRLMRGQNPLPFKEWANNTKGRGMSIWHDLVDWVGGYPFEVAKPSEIINFYNQRGFLLLKLKTRGKHLGCNEFIFIKDAKRDK